MILLKSVAFETKRLFFTNCSCLCIVLKRSALKLIFLVLLQLLRHSSQQASKETLPSFQLSCLSAARFLFFC